MAVIFDWNRKAGLKFRDSGHVLAKKEICMLNSAETDYWVNLMPKENTVLP